MVWQRQCHNLMCLVRNPFRIPHKSVFQLNRKVLSRNWCHRQYVLIYLKSAAFIQNEYFHNFFFPSADNHNQLFPIWTKNARELFQLCKQLCSDSGSNGTQSNRNIRTIVNNSNMVSKL